MAAASAGGSTGNSTCAAVEDYTQCKGIAYTTDDVFVGGGELQMFTFDEELEDRGYTQKVIEPTDKKYSFFLMREPESGSNRPEKMCVDIRQVVYDISEKHRQRYGFTGNTEKILYFKPDNLKKIIQKEITCLGSSKVLQSIASFRNTYLPSENESKKLVRIEFLKTFVLIFKLLINIHPAQTIISDNLESPLKQLYTQTSEYKRGVRESEGEITIDESRIYNPFCRSERKSTLSAGEISENDKVYRAYAEEQSMSEQSVIENLDAVINSIKGKCLYKFLETFFNEETKDLTFPEGTSEDKIFKQKIEHCYNFLKQLRSYNEQDNFIRYIQAIFGGTCMRNMAVNMIAIINFLNGIINTESDVIPELNLNYTGGAIPDKYKHCFDDLLGDPSHTSVVIVSALSSKYHEEFSRVGGGSAGGSQRKRRRMTRKRKMQKGVSRRQRRRRT